MGGHINGNIYIRRERTFGIAHDNPQVSLSMFGNAVFQLPGSSWPVRPEHSAIDRPEAPAGFCSLLPLLLQHHRRTRHPVDRGGGRQC